MATTKKTAAKRVASRPSAPAIEVHERLTRIETLVEAHITAQVETNKSLSASLAEISTSLTKYKGFWGALTLIGGAIAALVSFLKDPLMKKLGLQ